MNPGELARKSFRQIHETVEGAVDPPASPRPSCMPNLPDGPSAGTGGGEYPACRELWSCSGTTGGAWSVFPAATRPNPMRTTRVFAIRWRESAGWDVLKRAYLIFTRNMQDMLYATPGPSSKERRRAAFWWRSTETPRPPPTFLLTNPVALRNDRDTRELLVSWIPQFSDDLEAGQTKDRPSDFVVVGKNLAMTLGAVWCSAPIVGSDPLRAHPAVKEEHDALQVLHSDLNQEEAYGKGYLLEQGSIVLPPVGRTLMKACAM